jgi:DNA-binding transcriptional ArsR family regulator
LLDYRLPLWKVKPVVNNSPLLDRVFHALGDPTRRGILERLSERPISVSNLAEPFDMSLAAVLQHVRVLEDCGLVSTSKVGRTRTCVLEPAVLSAATAWMNDRRRAWELHFDQLDDFLASDPPDQT